MAGSKLVPKQLDSRSQTLNHEAVFSLHLLGPMAGPRDKTEHKKIHEPII